MRALASVLLLAVLLAAAGCRKSDPVRDFQSTEISFPDGQTVMAEVVSNQDDMARGMMFRDSLATDRGMLFMHPQAGKYTYWMYNVKIPLDLIWMDRHRRIVEIVPNAQPCKSKDPRACQHYGGNAEALYVLELAGGQAARHGLQQGQELQF